MRTDFIIPSLFEADIICTADGFDVLCNAIKIIGLFESLKYGSWTGKWDFRTFPLSFCLKKRCLTFSPLNSTCTPIRCYSKKSLRLRTTPFRTGWVIPTLNTYPNTS
jgi:hypothetical protein